MYAGNGQPPYGGSGQPGQPMQPVAPWQPGQGGPAQWNDLPQQPLAHDQVQGPPQDGPPPQEYVQKFDGYNNVGGFGQMAPISPPPPPPPPPQDQAPPQEFSRGAAVDEQACRDAMIKFASEHCCYGKGAAKEHRIDEIKPSNALHYTLESFCESRSTGYAYEPYRGQPIDGPQYGTPPGPWQIQCVPNSMFQTHEKQVEVPHTASVQRCHACKGFGFARCWRCYGMGQNRCQRCGGDGRIERRDADGGINLDHCHSCGGDGRQRCLTCGGDGRITCRVCQGYRQLKCCIMLTCTYTNHLDDHIIEETDMPDELVRGVKGESIFEQSLPQVWPIIAFPNQEINNNSMRLVEKHRTQWPNERILLQRQILRSVAVTEVAYSWKDVKSRYWVYGQEHKIHCPDYPQTCCCTIL